MEITGRIFLVLPEVTGMSKAGRPWKKREYVLETLDSSYPKRIHFDFFGERAEQYPLNVGEVGTLSFDIESREYNGRWYTQIRGWGWRPETAGATPAQGQAPYGSVPAPQPGYQAPQGGIPTPPPIEQGAPDDLPF